MQYRLNNLSYNWPNYLRLCIHGNRALFLATLSKIQENDGHCMAITTRSGKQTIDPPMPSNEKKVTKDTDKLVDVDGELEDNTVKDAEVPKKVTPMPRPPTHFLKDY